MKQTMSEMKIEAHTNINIMCITTLTVSQILNG